MCAFTPLFYIQVDSRYGCNQNLIRKLYMFFQRFFQLSGADADVSLGNRSGRMLQ